MESTALLIVGGQEQGALVVVGVLVFLTRHLGHLLLHVLAHLGVHWINTLNTCRMILVKNWGKYLSKN